MPESIPKVLTVAAATLGAIVLTYFAYTRPGYFTSQTYMSGVLLLELMIASVWMYRKVFLPLVLCGFLLAGVELPYTSMWTMARWGVLGVGALVGSILVLKEHRYRFHAFHVFAFFSVLAAMVSAAVSRYVVLSFLKVLSLLLLFLYAATGARIAVSGRENRFFAGLLTGFEVFVGIVAAMHFLGREVMGNPNSLGAVMGVAAVPILFWGVLLPQEAFSRRRRMFFFVVAFYLVFASHARAGLLAATLVCSLLCLALRRYAMLAQGLAIVLVFSATSAIVQPEAFSRTLSSLTSSVIYKGKDPAEGLLGSRKSPWQTSVESIQKHTWFGTGFGTADNGQDTNTPFGKFSGTGTTTAENGSSYLAITAWVGMVGLLPFVLLLATLGTKIFQTILWLFRTHDPRHAAVPLAMVLLAGLIHVGFEDWLFAPGYYLCVFFWCTAFIFMDQVSLLPVPENRNPWFLRNSASPQNLPAVAPIP